MKRPEKYENFFKQEKSEKVIHLNIPQDGNNLIASGSLKNFEFCIPKSKEKCMVNHYSIPKLAVGTKKKNFKELEFKNHNVNDFLKRFKKKDDDIKGFSQRKGVNGWKLVELKKKKIISLKF